MDEPIFFENAVVGLFQRTLGPRLDAGVRARLSALGLDLGRPLLPGYPVPVWEEALGLCASALHPGLPASESHFAIGRGFMAGYEQTPLGAATVERGRVLGVERALARLSQNVRSANNFMAMTVTQVSPGLFEIRNTLLPAFEGRVPPSPAGTSHYLRGLLTGLLAALGAQGEVTTALDDTARRAYVFRVQVGA